MCPVRWWRVVCWCVCRLSSIGSVLQHADREVRPPEEGTGGLRWLCPVLHCTTGIRLTLDPKWTVFNLTRPFVSPLHIRVHAHAYRKSFGLLLASQQAYCWIYEIQREVLIMHVQETHDSHLFYIMNPPLEFHLSLCVSVWVVSLTRAIVGEAAKRICNLWLTQAALQVHPGGHVTAAFRHIFQ